MDLLQPFGFSVSFGLYKVYKYKYQSGLGVNEWRVGAGLKGVHLRFSRYRVKLKIPGLLLDNNVTATVLNVNRCNKCVVQCDSVNDVVEQIE